MQKALFKRYILIYNIYESLLRMKTNQCFFHYIFFVSFFFNIFSLFLFYENIYIAVQEHIKQKQYHVILLYCI